MELNNTIPEDKMDKHLAHLMYKKYLSDITPADFVKFQKQWIKEHQPKEKIYQMFTLTTDPKNMDLKAQEDYIRGLLKRKENLQMFHLEYTKEHWDTNPHFHVVIGAYKQIPPDALKSYKKFGFIKKSRKTSRNIEGLQDYVNKENNSIVLLTH